MANERRNGSPKGCISLSAALGYLGICSSRPREKNRHFLPHQGRVVTFIGARETVLPVKEQLPLWLITDFAGERNGKIDNSCAHV